MVREPAEHGTLARYNNYGCRCEQCSAVKRAYNKAHRPPSKNPTCAVDTAALRSAIESDSRTLGEIAEAAGYTTHASLCYVMDKGAAPFHRLDAIACALGMHMSQLLADPSEAWDAA